MRTRYLRRPRLTTPEDLAWLNERAHAYGYDPEALRALVTELTGLLHVDDVNEDECRLVAQAMHQRSLAVNRGPGLKDTWRVVATDLWG